MSVSAKKENSTSVEAYGSKDKNYFAIRWAVRSEKKYLTGFNEDIQNEE